MNIWKKYRISRNSKNNLHLHFDIDVDLHFKTFAMAFSRWLRSEYEFPVSLNVYFKNSEKIKLLTGKMAYGGFRWYNHMSPRIRVAAKVETHLLDEYDINDIYEMILSSFVHEITHYYQWIDELEQKNATSERQANFFRYKIIDAFFERTNYKF